MSNNDTAGPPAHERFVQPATAGKATGSQTIRNLPAWLYHAELDRQSCSLLKPLLISPAHYRAQFFRARQSTAAMEFGSLIHTLVLEPFRFHAEYVVLPARERLGIAEVRKVRAKHPGKHLIAEVDLHRARQLAQRVLERPFRGRPFGRYLEEGEPELTVFYDDPVTGVACRVRIDLWHADYLFDLKTTRHSLAEPFVRSAVDLHYDMQAYMYTLADVVQHGLDVPRPFVFMTVDSAEPFTTSARMAGSTFLENGRTKYQRAIGLYKACSDLDYWEEDSGTEDEIQIEPWQEYRPVCDWSARHG